MTKKQEPLTQENKVKLIIPILIAVLGVIGYFGESRFESPSKISQPVSALVTNTASQDVKTVTDHVLLGRNEVYLDIRSISGNNISFIVRNKEFETNDSCGSIPVFEKPIVNSTSETATTRGSLYRVIN